VVEVEEAEEEEEGEEEEKAEEEGFHRRSSACPQYPPCLAVFRHLGSRGGIREEHAEQRTALVPRRQGLADNARHVKGCNFTQTEGLELNLRSMTWRAICARPYLPRWPPRALASRAAGRSPCPRCSGAS